MVRVTNGSSIEIISGIILVSLFGGVAFVAAFTVSPFMALGMGIVWFFTIIGIIRR